MIAKATSIAKVCGTDADSEAGVVRMDECPSTAQKSPFAVRFSAVCGQFEKGLLRHSARLLC